MEYPTSSNDTEGPAATSPASPADRNSTVALRQLDLELVIRFLTVIAAVAVAIYLREFNITARPFHSDEGVNFGFLNGIREKGYYSYSHENYHGPLFFYLVYYYSEMFGKSELALRGWPMTAGVLMIFTLLIVRRGTGSLFLPLAAALIALSPTMLFQSRYFIHETTLVLGTALFAMSLFDWLVTSRARNIYLGALGVGIMVATKETWIITIAALGAAALCTRTPRFILQMMWAQRSHLAGGFILALVFNVMAYTGGLVWTEGLREAVLAIPQWFGRGVQKDVGHFKPFSYYVWTVFGTVEPQLLFAVVLALVLLVGVLVFVPPRRLRVELNDRNALIRYTGVWTLLITGLYSSVPYKTPWCIINMSLPALLFLAAVIDWIAQRQHPSSRIFAYGTSLVLLGSMVPFAIKYNYKLNPITGAPLETSYAFGAENPQSYVHTTQGMIDLSKLVTTYMDANPSARLLVAVNGYWPLPYYLRNYSKRMAYLVSNEPQKWTGEYDVMLMEKDVKWSSPDYTVVELRLSDVEETKAYFRVPGSRQIPKCYEAESLTPVLGSAPAFCG